jgi:hypothetical protein
LSYKWGVWGDYHWRHNGVQVIKHQKLTFHSSTLLPFELSLFLVACAQGVVRRKKEKEKEKEKEEKKKRVLVFQGFQPKPQV